MSNVNQEFNEEIQLYYTYCDIRDSKHVMIHLVVVGTVYSETTIVNDRSISTATGEIERIWLNRHGAPKKCWQTTNFMPH